jgi:hypothetical protein
MLLFFLRHIDQTIAYSLIIVQLSFFFRYHHSHCSCFPSSFWCKHQFYSSCPSPLSSPVGVSLFNRPIRTLPLYISFVTSFYRIYTSSIEFRPPDGIFCTRPTQNCRFRQNYYKPVCTGKENVTVIYR